VYLRTIACNSHTLTYYLTTILPYTVVSHTDIGNVCPSETTSNSRKRLLSAVSFAADYVLGCVCVSLRMISYYKQYISKTNLGIFAKFTTDTVYILAWK